MFQNESHKKPYTAADIDRYHHGQMSPAERNALERAALEDPFLEEALEGYVGLPQGQAPQDVDGLRDRLAARVGSSRSGVLALVRWWQVAAAIILVAGAGALWFMGRPREKTLADQSIIKTPAPQKVPQRDTVSPVGLMPGSEGNLSIVPAGTSTRRSRRVVRGRRSFEAFERRTTAPSLAARAPAAQASGASALASTPVVTATDSVALAASSDSVALADNQPKRVTVDNKTFQLMGKASGVVVSPAPASVAMGERQTESLGIRRLSLPVMRLDSSRAPSLSEFLRLQGNMVRDSTTNRYFITNRLVDPNNRPIAFATVQTLPTGTATLTDTNGMFTIATLDTSSRISIGAVGYESKMLHAYDLRGNYVSLTRTSSSLADVVVVGYGTSKKNAERAKIAQGPYHAVDDSTDVEPLDGWNSYNAYVATNIQPPNEVLKNHIHGDVALSFRLDQYGKPVNVRVDKSLCDACDAEAIRLLKAGPQWKTPEKGKKIKGRVKIHF